jgi:hypothetical protein
VSGAGGQVPPSEEEIRARLEEELKRIRVEDVLIQTVVTLINLGGQRLGLTEQSRETRDPGQTRIAIEAVRALLPLVEASEGAEAARPVRDALAQLQMAYAREAGGEAPPAAAEQAPSGDAPAPQAGEAPPTRQPEPPRQRPSGRLWVPPGSGT